MTEIDGFNIMSGHFVFATAPIVSLEATWDRFAGNIHVLNWE